MYDIRVSDGEWGVKEKRKTIEKMEEE